MLLSLCCQRFTTLFLFNYHLHKVCSVLILFIEFLASFIFTESSHSLVFSFLSGLTSFHHSVRFKSKTHGCFIPLHLQEHMSGFRILGSHFFQSFLLIASLPFGVESYRGEPTPEASNFGYFL